MVRDSQEGSKGGSKGGSKEQVPVSMLPRCQWCKADPAMVIPAPMKMAGAEAVVFHCANPKCRAVFSVRLMSVPAPVRGLVEIPQ